MAQEVAGSSPAGHPTFAGLFFVGKWAADSSRSVMPLNSENQITGRIYLFGAVGGVLSKSVWRQRSALSRSGFAGMQPRIGLLGPQDNHGSRLA